MPEQLSKCCGVEIVKTELGHIYRRDCEAFLGPKTDVTSDISAQVDALGGLTEEQVTRTVNLANEDQKETVREAQVDAQVKTRIHRIIRDAKYSAVSGLDSGWTEIYEPGLENKIESLIKQAELRARVDELEHVYGGYGSGEFTDMTRKGEDVDDRIAELQQQLKELEATNAHSN